VGSQSRARASGPPIGHRGRRQGFQAEDPETRRHADLSPVTQAGAGGILVVRIDETLACCNLRSPVVGAQPDVSVRDPGASACRTRSGYRNGCWQLSQGSRAAGLAAGCPALRPLAHGVAQRPAKSASDRPLRPASCVRSKQQGMKLVTVGVVVGWEERRSDDSYEAYS
jgi:hypothetical protein